MLAIPTIMYWIVVIHLIADFFLQSGSWAAKKYNSFDALLSHVYTYTVVTGLFWIIYQHFNYPYVDYIGIFIYCIINLTIHLLVDFLSSKVMHYYWEKQRFGSNIINWGFFTVLGIDQTIHLFTLIWSYNIFFTQ